MFKSGKVTLIEESRVFCVILNVLDKFKPIEGKVRE